MATNMYSPGVKVREIDFSTYASSTSSCVVGMVGGASKGPIGVATLCTSAEDYIRKFGETLGVNDYGPIAAIMYLTKGSNLWYVREASEFAKSAFVSFSGVVEGATQVESIKLEFDKIEVDEDPEILIPYGEEGEEITPESGMLTFEITSGILGSLVRSFSFTVTASTTLESLAERLRNAINSDFYLKQHYVASGSGAEIGMTAIAIADNDVNLNIIAKPSDGVNIKEVLNSTKTRAGNAGTVVPGVLKMYYKEMGTYAHKFSAKLSNSDGLNFTLTIYQGNAVIDSFNASLDENSSNYIMKRTRDDYYYEVNLGGVTDVVDSDKMSFAGGDNGLPLESSDIIGVGTRGLQAFTNPNVIDISILCAPGWADVAVISTVINICESRADCIAIIDPPAGLNVSEMVNYHNGALEEAEYPKFTLDSSYAAMYYPWVKILDPTDNTGKWVPPSTVVLGAIALSDEKAAPWFAPAGMERGKLPDVLEAERDLTENDNNNLYGYGNSINPILNVRRQGFVIWGQRTLQRNSTSLDRINVRRMVLYVRKLVVTSSAYVVFEQNDESTWRRWRDMITPFLESVKINRGLYAYQVIMDESTVTAEHIDRNEMPGKVLLQPTKTAEFVTVDFVLKSTGADFSE